MKLATRSRVSASIVKTPRAALPTPAATNAAAAGPLGLSIRSIPSLLASYERGRLRDERAEQSRYARRDEREGEHYDQRPAQVRPLRYLQDVVEHHERNGARQHGRDPSHVLLPLHPAIVPRGQIRVCGQVGL